MDDRLNGVSEDELHAYVDGLLPADRHAAVEAALAADPDLAAVAAAWRAQNDAIRSAFPLEAMREEDRSLAQKARPRLPYALLAASVAGAFALGAATGFGFGRIESEPAQIAAVDRIAKASRANYVVYSGEVRHPVEVKADEKDHLVAWLGKKLGGELRAPDLQAQGFQLVGGRLVTYGDAPGAMLMYQDESGARLTMLTARNENNGQTGFRFDRTGDVNTFYWIDGPFGFAISGAVARERLETVADAIYAQIGG